ncbi:MAG: SEL1-like repeat protein [Planctomycetes bacterium]|nr:SEL1-like repeat protein [Planctomycetota bacterium]
MGISQAGINCFVGIDQHKHYSQVAVKDKEGTVPKLPPKLPITELQMKAEAGDAKAQYRLGRLYYDGKGVDKDEKKAITFFKLAAKQGHKKSISMLKALGESIPAVVQFAPQIQPPAAPGNLVATAVSPHQIDLSWTDNSDNEQGFIVESKTSCYDPFVQIATVGPNNINYSHTGLLPGTVHYYRVCAYNQAGNSNYSNKAAAVTFADIPVVGQTIDLLNNYNTQGAFKNPGIYNSLLTKLNTAQSYISQGNYQAALEQLNALLNAIKAQTGKGVTVEVAEGLAQSVNTLADYLSLRSGLPVSFKLYLYGYPCENETVIDLPDGNTVRTKMSGDLTVGLAPTGNPDILSITINEASYTGTAFTVNGVDFGESYISHDPNNLSQGTLNCRTGEIVITEKVLIKSAYLESIGRSPLPFQSVAKGTFYPFGLRNGVIQTVSQGVFSQTGTPLDGAQYSTTSRKQAKKPKTKIVVVPFQYVETETPRQVLVKLVTDEPVEEEVTETPSITIMRDDVKSGNAIVTSPPLTFIIPVGQTESDTKAVILDGTKVSKQEDDVTLIVGFAEERFSVIDLQATFNTPIKPDFVCVDGLGSYTINLLGPQGTKGELINEIKITPDTNAKVLPMKFYTFAVNDSLTLRIYGKNPSTDLNKTNFTATAQISDVTINLEMTFTVIKLEKIELVSGATMVADGTATPADTDICAAIKETGDVLLKAVIKPASVEPLLPPDAIIWKGGEGVSGNQLQRKVSKSTWVKNTVTATLYGTNRTVTMLAYIIGAEPTDFSPRNGTGGTHFSDNNAAWFVSTGVFGPNSTTGSYASRCEIEFTVKPDILITDGNANLFDKTQIQWDVSRNKRVKVWRKTAGTWSVIDDRSSSWPTNDTVDTDEDNNPWDGNGHLYGNDEPSWAGSGQGIVDKMNMREWVRVGLGGVSGRDGVRCSDYYLWHVFRSIKLNGIWSADNTYGNEIALGNIFWGAIPIAGVEITTASLPDGKVGQVYSQTLSSSGGTAPIIWSLDIGTLPPGLILNASGGISGTPTLAGTFTFDVEAQDSSPALPSPPALSGQGPSADIQTLTIKIKK